MKKVLNIVARILGGIFYPLWIPTYGMLLYCVTISKLYTLNSTLSTLNYTLPYMLIALLGTLFFTGIVPFVAILILIRRKQVTDLYISNPQERTSPYLYTLCSFGFWCYFLYAVMHIPSFFLYSAIGATVALGLVMVINKRWKISAHLTGFGGLIGGIFSWFLYCNFMPAAGFVALLLGVALLLMYSRLYVNAHTPLQVVCGLLLGILFTFVPNLILTYAK